MVTKYLAGLRKEFTQGGLAPESLAADPRQQLQLWLDEAIAVEHTEPNAMTLATAGADGRPHARVVLLKGLEEGGLVFYTNYQSAKGREMAENPWVSVLFFWPLLERQVRVEGKVQQLPSELSDAYFASRPRVSQLGAWASPQSEEVSAYEVLEQRFREVEERFKGRPVPRPPHWGGYLLVPDSYEFWQGRPGRLHQRYRYVSSEGSDWRREVLAP